MWNYKQFLWLCLAAVVCSGILPAPSAAQCPAKTSISDTLYNADGSLASGRVVISWPTFLIGSCQVIAGQTAVTVTNGAFTVQLYPNSNATPAGTSYRISYALKSGRVTTEYWVVPASAIPVSLASVRASSVPVPNVMFGEAQVTNLIIDLSRKVELPSPCPVGKILQSNGSSLPPQVNCADPSSGAGSQHQTNGANLAANDPINFQDTSTIAITNPSAGNVQAAVKDAAITAAKLSVTNPSASQLSGVGDANIAGGAISPNRVAGTAVVQSRSVGTTAPLGGGGDLSADRTINCPTCEVNTNKGLSGGYASLNASSKVVQDPANTQAAPAASKIPLADATGKIADGWLSDNVSLLGSAIDLSTEVSGQLSAAKGGTGANNTPTAGLYLRGNGTNFVTSSVAAGGAGSCTNQFVRTTNDNATPTCASVGGSDFVNQSANLIFTGPASGAAAAPAFRAMVKADTPSTTVHSDQANSWSAGFKQSVGHNTTTAGLNLIPAAGDPSGPANGDIWYNSTSGKFRCYEAGTAKDCIAVWGGGGLGDPGANGVVVRTSLNTTVARTITGTAGNISVTDGDGVSANPTINLGSTAVQTDQANTWTTGAQDMGAASSFVVPKAAAANPTADGDERFDTTQKVFAAGGNGAVTGYFPRVLKMTNCTTEGNCTSASGGNQVDANSGAQGTTETNFASNWSMPAGFLFANKAVQVCVVYELTTSASAPTLTLRLKAGTTVLVANTAIAPANSQTNKGFGQCYIVQGTAAAGASVNVEAGYLGLLYTLGANSLNTVNQPIAIATNAAQTIQISAQWGAATNGNTIRVQQFFVIELN